MDIQKSIKLILIVLKMKLHYNYGENKWRFYDSSQWIKCHVLIDVENMNINRLLCFIVSLINI